MSDRESVFPASALSRVWHWEPAKWILSAGAVAGLGFAQDWARSRAGKSEIAAVQEQVADEVQVLLTPRDSDARIITLTTRFDGLDARVKKAQDASDECTANFLRMRLDQIGFVAASSQPRAALRAETAAAARKAYLDLIKQNEPPDTDEQKAYRRALETRPPR